MDKTILEKIDIEKGRELIKALDEEKFPINGALWFFNDEKHSWQFILSSPKYEDEGPLEIYKVIQTTVDKENIDLPLTDINVINPNDNLMKLLRMAFNIGQNEIGGIRFSHNVINGTYIPDAYLYRVY